MGNQNNKPLSQSAITSFLSIASSLTNPCLSSSFSQPRSPQPSPPSQPTTVAHPLSLLFLSSFLHFSLPCSLPHAPVRVCQLWRATPRCNPAAAKFCAAATPSLSRSSFSPSSTQAMQLSDVIKVGSEEMDLGYEVWTLEVGAHVGRNEPYQFDGFMSLLNSFDNS
nr:uncharacterized protein LOC114925991 [Arachis hypogaea]